MVTTSADADEGTAVERLLHAHGIDPSSLISFDAELLAHCPTSAVGIASPTHTRTVPRNPTSAATAAIEGGHPTSINFPTNVLYRTISAKADEVIHSRAVFAVMPQKFRDDDAGQRSDAAVEAEVRHLLQSRVYRPLPVLEELDRDLEIQRRALEEHAAYTRRCEEGTLFTGQPGEHVLLLS